MSKARFVEVYAAQLVAAVTDHPEEYSFPAATVPAVVERISAALDRHSYSKDGRAFRGTCKALGIAYTYAAINAFCEAV